MSLNRAGIWLAFALSAAVCDDLNPMPKRRDDPGPKPPTISLEQGKRRLQAMRDKGIDMLRNRPLSESTVETWANTSFDYVKQTFGESSNHLNTFRGQVRITMVEGVNRYDVYAEREDAETLQRRVEVLNTLIDLIDQELSFSPSPAVRSEDFWSRLHPSVVRVSKARFEAGQYADAVEAAFKELNSTIKEHIRKPTGQEYDGADLMNRAFSPNSPLIRVSDLSTEDGKSMQKGYMQIFSGAMTGIRNPKAHSNVIVDEKRAIHHLHLASLLHHVSDERL